MAEVSDQSVLRRKVRPPSGAGQGTSDTQSVTPSRALRTTFARAAERVFGLVLNVLGVTNETNLALDDLLDQIPDTYVLIGVEAGGQLIGLAAADPETLAVSIEKQTTGRVSAQKAGQRSVTGTDAALLAPLFTRVLMDLPGACIGTALAGWADAASVGGLVPDKRTAALQLEDRPYRLVRMTLDFGIGEREGEAILALAVDRGKAAPDVAPAPSQDWNDTLQAAVMSAPAVLHAVLHRMRLSLKMIESFEVGQVLPLAGVTVASVRLFGPDGKVAASARLGQVSGMRAVRIEAERPRELTETRMGQALASTEPGRPDAGPGPAAPVDKRPAAVTVQSPAEMERSAG